MNLDLSEEQVMLRNTVRRFADRQLDSPLAAESDRAEALSRFRSELDQLGLWSLTAPEEAGGFGLGSLTASIVVEELARHDSGLAILVSMHLATIAPVICAGESSHRNSVLNGSAAIGLIWPDTSSDSVKAQRCQDGWKLRGNVSGLSPVDGLDQSLLICPVVDEPDSSGFFLVTTTKNWSSEPFSLGLGGLARVTGTIDEVASGDNQVIDAPTPTRTTSGPISLGFAAAAIGIGKAALEEALVYADDRKQFGRSLNKFQAIRFKLADMATGLDTARWALRRAAGTGNPELAGLALHSATDAAVFAADEALQIHGGYGYTEEYPVERLYRDSRELKSLAHRWLRARTNLYEDQ